jgi:uncharacterized protein YndB with AHSA1/START domain
MTTNPDVSDATIEINAPVEHVFELVTDLTRMGEWSPECYKVTWDDGHDGPKFGATFTGFNRVDAYEWEAPGEITDFSRNRVFEFQVPRGSLVATTWRFEFESSGDSTTLRESFHAPMLNQVGSPSNFPGRFEMLHNGIVATVASIKAAAEAK